MIKCWFCDFVTDINDTNYGDHICPNCGIMLSVYDPSMKEEAKQPLTTQDEYLAKKEEEMIDYKEEKYQGRFVYLPRIGEEITIEIKELREVKSDNPKFNFSENVPVMISGEPAIDDEGEIITKKKDLGYHIEAELKNGKILSVTSIAAFIQVFKKNELNDGDKVHIKHIEKGIWEVEKL